MNDRDRREKLILQNLTNWCASPDCLVAWTCRRCGAAVVENNACVCGLWGIDHSDPDPRVMVPNGVMYVADERIE